MEVEFVLAGIQDRATCITGFGREERFQRAKIVLVGGVRDEDDLVKDAAMGFEVLLDPVISAL